MSSPLGGPGAARVGAGADLRGLPWAFPFRVGSERRKDAGICVVARLVLILGPAHKFLPLWLRLQAPPIDPLLSAQHWHTSSTSNWPRPWAPPLIGPFPGARLLQDTPPPASCRVAPLATPSHVSLPLIGL